MESGTSLYGALSYAHRAAYDIAQALEQEYFNGTFDKSKQTVLAACYSVIDFFANLIGRLNFEEAEKDYDDLDNFSSDLMNSSAELMREFSKLLEDDLLDEACPSRIDYRKVQALVGLREVSQYIEKEYSYADKPSLYPDVLNSL